MDIREFINEYDVLMNRGKQEAANKLYNGITELVDYFCNAGTRPEQHLLKIALSNRIYDLCYSVKNISGVSEKQFYFGALAMDKYYCLLTGLADTAILDNDIGFSDFLNILYSIGNHLVSEYATGYRDGKPQFITY